MSRFTQSFCLLVALGVASHVGVARAQDASENQQPAPAASAADPQSSAIQPAQDPDTANELQQLRSVVDQLQQQVSRLTTAVEELQADRIQTLKAAPATRSKGKPAAAAKKTAVTPITPLASNPESDEKTPLTVLVFRDGHRTGARNYAIVGQTLWIYTDQDSKKVPLADLDVSATKEANSDRGVVFQVPPTR